MHATEKMKIVMMMMVGVVLGWVEFWMMMMRGMVFWMTSNDDDDDKSPSPACPSEKFVCIRFQPLTPAITTHPIMAVIIKLFLPHSLILRLFHSLSRCDVVFVMRQ
jgi:hypothetical protein